MGLELSPADVVADIGAGTGYFTFRLCKHVPHGRVYAVDVQQEMLDLIEKRVAEEQYGNVVTVLGTARNPNLPPESVDLALMVDSYHEFSHPREMMENIVLSLRPGGRVVLVEYRAEDGTIPVKDVHRMTESQARLEMEAVGLVWRETKDILPQQHFIVFEKPIP
jgi:ubiquinone/menaquinone biosynthesis C-methylase UbiE